MSTPEPERMSSAAYRALLERGEKPKGKPRRGAEAGNPYRGLRCVICGQPVLASDAPVQHHTNLETGEVWVKHLEHKLEAATAAVVEDGK